MTPTLKHDMAPSPDAEAAARGRFVSGIRSFILNDLAADMKTAYDKRAAPAWKRAHGDVPATSGEAHKALRGDPAFNIYSAMRVQAQRMVWQSVGRGVARDMESLLAAEKRTADRPGGYAIDPDFEVPRNVDAIDVHLMPGSYTAGADGLDAGAMYDRGLAVFSMGLMGDNLDDIGRSMAAWVTRKYPDFAPRRILDLGCTVGHNSLPWKHAYPQAELIGIDAAPGVLRYASARAKMQDVEAEFRQMSADALAFEDDSFDLVFSSMFLHELPGKVRAKVFEEARRVLRPGGLMLHMELPPNDQTGAFEGFYLDWDSYYNSEPYYKGYRDEKPADLCRKAGFAEEDYLQFVVPSVGIYGADAVDEAIAAEDADTVANETTGRLAEGVMWYGFGAWKAA